MVLLGALQACHKSAGTSPSHQPGTVIPAAEAAPAAANKVDLSGYRLGQDLLTSRVFAILYRGGHMILPAGDVGFYKFVNGGWKASWILGRKDAGTRVAYVSGISASFGFPLDTDGDGATGRALADVRMTLVMRSAAPKQRLSVFANEKPVTTIEVGKDLAGYDVTLPAADLKVGDNRVRLTFRSAAAIGGGKRSAAAIEGIEIGPAQGAGTPAGKVPTIRGIGAPVPTDLGGAKKLALAFPGPSRLSYYVQIPAKAKLALSLGAPRPGSTALIRITRDGAPTQTLFDGPAPQRFTDFAFDLSGFAGQAVRIDLVSRGGGIAWAEPRLMVPSTPVAQRPGRVFKHVYVWMCDTLRADKVHVYNPKTNVKTPNYDAFAADATRFEWSQTQGTWSLPSQASMLTGVYPDVHRAIGDKSKISAKVPLAAELFKKAGFRTGLFSSNGYISAKWGFDRGFEADRNFVRENLPNGADYLWSTAKKWILPNKDKPQFVYLAIIEPHVIYNPKKQFLQMYWNKPYNGPIKPRLTGIQLGEIKAGKLKPNATDKAYLEALHNAEITQSDAAFGVFVADLKAAGLWDKSVVVVISDHGDEFWEHGDVGHAQAPHQELTHVPFMIHAPGVLPAGHVVQTEVENMDMTPTLLDLAGLPIPDSMQGESLVPVVFDETAYIPSTGLTEDGSVARGIKSGRYRLIDSGGGHIELYDEIADPREQKNLEDKRPIALRQMRDLLALQVGFEDVWKKRIWGSPADPKEAFYAANEK